MYRKKGSDNSEIYPANHQTFGGRVYIGDFDRKITLSEMTERILSDKKFDSSCNGNAQNRERIARI